MVAPQPGIDFRPTHRIPATGLASYPAADPATAPGPWLDAGLDLQVLEQRPDGWARITFSNGWTTWADGRELLPLARFIPAGGLATFANPDPQQRPGVSLNPGLKVAVIEQRPDGWTQVVCSNGWQAWVDGRLLVNSGPAAHRAVSGRAATTVDDLYGRWLPLAAGVTVLVGALLPWFRTPVGSISSWKVSVWFLLLRRTTDAQPHIGLVLLVLVVLIVTYAVVPWAFGQRVSRRVLFAGAILAVDLALFYFARWLHPATGIGLDIGPVLVLAGGALAAVSHWRTRPAGDIGRWGWL